MRPALFTHHDPQPASPLIQLQQIKVTCDRTLAAEKSRLNKLDDAEKTPQALQINFSSCPGYHAISEIVNYVLANYTLLDQRITQRSAIDSRLNSSLTALENRLQFVSEPTSDQDFSELIELKGLVRETLLTLKKENSDLLQKENNTPAPF